MNTSPNPSQVSLSIVKDPFNPKRDLEVTLHDEGISVTDFVSAKFPETGNFPHAVICTKNGAPLMRADWGKPLVNGDMVVFIPAIGDPVTIIIWLVVIVVALVVALVVSGNQTASPDTTIGETPEADPVFDLRGQRNQKKLSNPIECGYGRFRIWPSYASAPYNKAVNNDVFLFQLFCLGHGKISIEQIFIEDTPIEEFQGVEYEVLEPGEPVTLFPDNVFTSTEVGGIELFGPNEAAFTDWSAAFTACPPLTTTTKIEVDVHLPRGAYFQSGGALTNRTVIVDFQVRRIDDAGTAIGNWLAGVTFTKTLKTTTPQRYTLEIPVAEGRYEVRAVRTNNAETNFAGADQIKWVSLRAFLPSVLTYSGVTMLAMKAKASNNLNDSASSRVNLIATRKLRVYDADSGVWVDDIATRSPVWAFCDIFTSSYGGRLPDEFLDVVGLAAIAEQMDSEGIFFDWLFDQRATTWEAAKVVASVCRGVPILNGSRITMALERPQVLPLHMFNANTIIRDSFNYELKLREVASHDGIEVEYLNSNWQPETVMCLAPGDVGDKPKVVKVPGCTDRTRAYRLGMYKRMCEVLLRTNINFNTGLEGMLPAYGDLIAIAHPLPRWGVGGYVVSINGDDVTLSEDVTFGVGTHYLMLRKKDGSVFGPAVCVATASARVVTVSDTITPADFHTQFSNAEPAIFLFGTSTTYAKLATVAELVPQGDEEVQVKCLGYNAGVFAYDEASPPTINAPYYVPKPVAVPVVKNLEVFAHNTSLIVISWEAIEGVVQYVVESSNDGEVFNAAATTKEPFYVMPVEQQHLWLRVSATTVGTGVAATWDGEVGIALAAPSNIAGLAIATWEGLDIAATWTAYTTGASIDGYLVRVFTRPTGGSYKLARSARTSTNSFTYTYAMAVEDNAADREVKMLVTAINIVAESATAAVDTETNPAPGTPTDLVATNLGVFGSVRRWRLSWTGTGAADLRFFRVWVSSINNFAVTSQYVEYEGTDTSFVIEVPATPNAPFAHNSPARYFRVAELDVWGEEFTESAQKTVPAFNDQW